MSSQTKIEWADATWNPITGCSKVSEGCRNCYALRFAERFRGIHAHYFEKGFDITLRPNMLDLPLSWKKPKKVFVNSMSDLFHPEVPFEYIDKVFDVMVGAGWHTYQVLTKRPERMNDFMKWRFARSKNQFDVRQEPYIFPNIWLGVSIENQKAADERIPQLLQTPAVVRFLSIEPLLGSVNLKFNESVIYRTTGWQPPLAEYTRIGELIDWVIVGGESGPGARPMHPKWVRGIRDQCQAAGVPFFFKQWGEWRQVQGAMVDDHNIRHKHKHKHSFDSDTVVVKVGKRKAGRLLDGREWNEYPSMED
ncbi:DUF5131 family protein [Paenibacillus elgii]|uniref:DUF5131 family protein n=1 Tax=Paenibacillus elgii TaxID=189691 RepID=UPI0013D81B0C|nr:phage Gp37/Gp68 family protein [Paenibacillus elgii]